MSLGLKFQIYNMEKNQFIDMEDIVEICENKFLALAPQKFAIDNNGDLILIDQLGNTAPCYIDENKYRIQLYIEKTDILNISFPGASPESFMGVGDTEELKGIQN